MRKSITKKEIIKALKNEPLLRRKAWFGTSLDQRYPKNCSVCAVGSVLRAMSFEKWARKVGFSLGSLGDKAVGIPYVASIVNYGMTKVNLKNKNYLAALSCFFESGRTRKQCLCFIKKNFPEKLTLNIVAWGK